MDLFRSRSMLRNIQFLSFKLFSIPRREARKNIKEISSIGRSIGSIVKFLRSLCVVCIVAVRCSRPVETK